MKTYGWVSAQRDPPERWDLRRLGWHLCGSERRVECRHVLIVDAPREVVANSDRLFRHLLMVGVDDPLERTRLLTMGCAEAVPSTIGLHELEARARRVNEMFGMLPRWRTFGSLTLDLFHRERALADAGWRCIRASSSCSGGWPIGRGRGSRADSCCATSGA
ncbi:MAG: hypothetical protein ACO1OD_10350 [Croceibacterium sp.]